MNSRATSSEGVKGNRSIDGGGGKKGQARQMKRREERNKATARALGKVLNP